MPIHFRCCFCNQLLGIAHRKAGTVIDCPTCRGKVWVPDPNAPPGAAPAPAPEPGYDVEPVGPLGSVSAAPPGGLSTLTIVLLLIGFLAILALTCGLVFWLIRSMSGS